MPFESFTGGAGDPSSSEEPHSRIAGNSIPVEFTALSFLLTVWLFLVTFLLFTAAFGFCVIAFGALSTLVAFEFAFEFSTGLVTFVSTVFVAFFCRGWGCWRGSSLAETSGVERIGR